MYRWWNQNYISDIVKWYRKTDRIKGLISQLLGCNDNDPPEAMLVRRQVFSEFSPAETITSGCACNSHRYQEDLQTENIKCHYSLLGRLQFILQASVEYIFITNTARMCTPVSTTLFNLVQKGIKEIYITHFGSIYEIDDVNKYPCLSILLIHSPSPELLHLQHRCLSCRGKPITALELPYPHSRNTGKPNKAFSEPSRSE